MSPLAVVLLVVGLLGWVAAAFAIGLWLGEKGRREASERYLLTGSPNAPLGGQLPDIPDAESRVLSAGRAAADATFTESTIQKGVDQLIEEARLVGRNLTPADAREQVMAMLYGTAGDNDLPGFG